MTKWREFTLATLAIQFVCGILVYAMGKDLNWDYFNYHDYLSGLNWDNRLSKDFFAAGYQGYQNPKPYVLLGWMLSNKLHSLSMGLILGAVHAINLVFLYLISREIFENSARPIISSWLTVVMAGVSGIYLSQLGSTFVDLIATPFVFLALYLVLRIPSLFTILASSFLMGIASGLKLTNAPYTAAFLAVIPWFLSGSPKINILVTWSLASFFAMLGFLAMYVDWGYALYREFESPFFPIFNSVFGSSDFPNYSISYHRFIPASVEGWLMKPVEWAGLGAWRLTEALGADVRPLVFLLLIPLIFLKRMIPGGGRWSWTNSQTELMPCSLNAFLLISILLWALTSSNGRYAIPVFFLISLYIIWIVNYLFPARWAVLISVCVIGIQLSHGLSAGNPRYNAHHWTSTWLPADIPSKLSSEPALYVSVNKSSESYLVRYLHPQSRFINPIGLISLKSDGPGWDRFQRMLQDSAGNIKMVFESPPPGVTLGALDEKNTFVNRLGLKILFEKCDDLRFNADDDLIRAPWVESITEEYETGRARRLSVCDASRVVPSPELDQGRRLATEIMDAYEAHCPKYLFPPAVQVEGGAGGIWIRSYEKYDLEMKVDFSKDVVSYRRTRQFTDVVLGRVSQWKQNALKFKCALPHDGRQDLSTLRAVRENN